MRRTALSGCYARTRSEVRPLKQFAGIMPPVPPWRFAPFRAPAASDVNLCTDSVLPGVIVPVRLRCAWVLWPLLSRIPFNFQLLEYRMVPFPTLASQRHSSFLTGLIASLAGFALPSRAPSRVGGLGNPRPKAPAITAEDPLPPPCSGGAPGILLKIVLRGPRLFRTLRHQGMHADAAEGFHASRTSLRFTRQSNSRSGAYGRSSRCRAPET
jgi:hypothetical protein